MGKWLKKLEKWMGGGEEGAKRFNSFRWLLILGLIGVAIMLFNSFVNVKKVDPENVGREPPGVMKNETVLETAAGEGSAFTGIERVFEDNMKQMLEQIVGVGTVDVMVTVDSTEEIIVQRNVKDMQEENNETDANGGQRHTTQYTRDGEIVTYESSGGKHTPIITKKVKPQVRGVLVVARGAENPTVKQLIIDAVQKGLNVPSYKISVVPRKQG
ncbi:stage III sporulation protein AG [Paenibacillus farraposensis]|uniref:Stage III sporulation protein AG n=1 Tax=Paenibacillus farraposensis TaxID=2807095 RepID=A0ABW4DDL2_9BACL|nr:stage III sporulation protein AG [Paenibacillus farraposensis]MCC3379726.1 stage III sporulation protein AG [Paenibacillus farraposensis]